MSPIGTDYVTNILGAEGEGRGGKQKMFIKCYYGPSAPSGQITSPTFSGLMEKEEGEKEEGEEEAEDGN